MDIGTGDGRFVYQMARKNPEKLYIGIDAASENLSKISEKIYRNPKHGGAKNALFLQARVEELPEELNNIADEVHVHFPWGSLLAGVLKPDETIIRSLRRICKSGALLEIITSIDEARDVTQLERLGISGSLNEQYVESKLSQQFKQAGLIITEYASIPAGHWPQLCTSWTAKLNSGGNRGAYYLIAQAL